jgi:hypothetical protein
LVMLEAEVVLEVLDGARDEDGLGDGESRI